MKLIDRLKCKLGWHDWRERLRFPIHKFELILRVCVRCGKKSDEWAILPERRER